MKKLTLTILTLLISILGYSQNNQGISFQSVVRGANGKIIAESPVSVRFSILNSNMFNEYSEVHNTQTNASGLFSLQIGKGQVISGDFSAIDWGIGAYSLQTEIDPTGGNQYSITSTQQLLHVPYSYHAKTAGISNGVKINGGLAGQVLVSNQNGEGSWQTVPMGNSNSQYENNYTAVYNAAQDIEINDVSVNTYLPTLETTFITTGATKVWLNAEIPILSTCYGCPDNNSFPIYHQFKVMFELDGVIVATTNHSVFVNNNTTLTKQRLIEIPEEGEHTIKVVVSRISPNRPAISYLNSGAVLDVQIIKQ